MFRQPLLDPATTGALATKRALYQTELRPVLARRQLKAGAGIEPAALQSMRPREASLAQIFSGRSWAVISFWMGMVRSPRESKARANVTRIAPGGVETSRRISVRRGPTVKASDREGAAWEWAIGAHRIGYRRPDRARKRVRRGDARWTSGNGGDGMKKVHGTRSERRKIRPPGRVVKSAFIPTAWVVLHDACQPSCGSAPCVS